MAKLKGKKKLNKAITELVKPFGISKAKLGKKFLYFFVDEHIEFKITCGEWGDQVFDDFLFDYFNFVNPYPFVMFILHEVGHHITFDDLTETEVKQSIRIKDKMPKKMKNAKTLEDKKQVEYEYFTLPDELAATTWAVDYFTTHRKECDEMYKKACKALYKFYKKNGVTE
jgi:hypothetical protein